MSKAAPGSSPCGTWPPTPSSSLGQPPYQAHFKRPLIHSRQVGQTSSAEVKKRDLRAELLAAETEAKNKKRKAEGKPPLPIENGGENGVDEESSKRRKLLQDAIDLDKDDDDKPDAEDEKKKENMDVDKDDDEERYVANHLKPLPEPTRRAVTTTLMRTKTTILQNCFGNWKRSNVNGLRRKPEQSRLSRRQMPQHVKRRQQPQIHSSTWLLLSAKSQFIPAPLYQALSRSRSVGTMVGIFLYRLGRH